MIDDKLVIETRRYETQINVLAKLKEMFKKESYSYFAGTLCIPVLDLITDEPYVAVDVNPIGESTDTLEYEIQYHVSKMYAKFKGSRCSYFVQAVKNIEDYESKQYERH